MPIKNILLLVEGEKTDTKLMNKLIKAYNLDGEFQIIPYKTNIYTLYKKIFGNDDEEYVDLIQVLKEDGDNSEILNKKFSDIYLVFDYEPQDNEFTKEKILKMSNYFSESTENGKLYLNYPMVESVYHTNLEEDDEFINRKVTLEEVGRYKQIVNTMTPDPRKLVNTKTTITQIILKNLKKANKIIGGKQLKYYIDLNEVLKTQLNLLDKHNEIFVLCTCVFFIPDYNPRLLED